MEIVDTMQQEIISNLLLTTVTVNESPLMYVFGPKPLYITK